MAGFGTISFGSGPYGLGTPATQADPPSGPAGCRYLNPASKDYEQDSTTGQLAQMPPLRQRVLLAVMTDIGSSTALAQLGRLRPRKIGPSFQAELSASIRAACRQMTEVERVMRIDAVTVELGASGRYRPTLSYTDVTTGESGSIPL